MDGCAAVAVCVFRVTACIDRAPLPNYLLPRPGRPLRIYVFGLNSSSPAHKVTYSFTMPTDSAVAGMTSASVGEMGRMHTNVLTSRITSTVWSSPFCFAAAGHVLRLVFGGGVWARPPPKTQERALSDATC